jgi:5'-nucleotidase
VALATLGVFGEPVDLVLAGVNPGLNTGSSTLYSATVGAVLAGRQRGLSGLALSQVDGRQANTPQLWHSATDIAMPIIRWLAGRTEPVSLNVNVPNLPLGEIQRIRQTGLAPQSSVQTEITGRDDHGVGFRLVAGVDEPSQDSDTALLRSGHATVSAIIGMATMEGLTLPLDEWV